MIWSRICWGEDKKLEISDDFPLRMRIVTHRRPGELLQSMREDLIRQMHGVASSWFLHSHRVQRGGPSRTQSYDDTGITRKAAFLATGRPSEKIFEYRYKDLSRKLRKATRAQGLKDFGATDSALEELTFGRLRTEDVFTTLSDGGRFFLNLISNDRVGCAAERLGVRAAFWNLRCGERYDLTHRVNLRRLLRDVANGEVLGCMMSVPSTGWNVPHNCHYVTLRSGLS